MALNITDQVRTISDVTTAVASGDLTKKVEIDVKGEMLDLKSTINNMVSQLSIFASEVTRVALEVGTEGKLGGQAKVEGRGGLPTIAAGSYRPAAHGLHRTSPSDDLHEGHGQL